MCTRACASVCVHARRVGSRGERKSRRTMMEALRLAMRRICELEVDRASSAYLRGRSRLRVPALRGRSHLHVTAPAAHTCQLARWHVRTVSVGLGHTRRCIVGMRECRRAGGRAGRTRRSKGRQEVGPMGERGWGDGGVWGVCVCVCVGGGGSDGEEERTRSREREGCARRLSQRREGCDGRPMGRTPM